MESKSRYAVSCFYIPKKNSSLQLVQDYRKLNQITIKDKMSLSLIGKVIDKLEKAKYFNKLNLIWGYNNVWIKVSKLKVVDSNYFHSSFYFYFLFDLFSFYSIFKTRIRVKMTRSYCHTISHIR